MPRDPSISGRASPAGLTHALTRPAPPRARVAPGQPGVRADCGPHGTDHKAREIKMSRELYLRNCYVKRAKPWRSFSQSTQYWIMMEHLDNYASRFLDHLLRNCESESDRVSNINLILNQLKFRKLGSNITL